MLRQYLHGFDLDTEKLKYAPRNGDPIMEYVFSDTPTRVIFVRHGRTDYNEKKWADAEDKARLNEEGKQQAQALIDQFKDTKIDAIYSSSMTRCVDTIRPLAEARDIAVQTDANLWEYRRPSFQDKEMGWETVRWTDEPIIEGDETTQQMYARVMVAFERILRENKGKTVVICTHG